MILDIWQTVIIATTTGAGSAVGSYLANKMLIRHLEKIDTKIRGKVK